MGNQSGEVQGRLVVDRYRLLELIGRGGMGRVWRAHDEVLGRPVAAKEIRIGELVGEDSAVQRERSLREARATARIDHPNVVRVYDVAEEDDRLWIVMELVDARSLEQVLTQDGPVEPREAARIGLGLARALRSVHAVGVLHRDIKPGNVLLTVRGRIVLTDFGIAAMQDAAALTMAGTLVGSPEYMAPERIEGREQGPPSDLWSLGATLCAAVGGRSPFTRATTLATLHAVLYEQPDIPDAAGPLRGLLTELLRKEPGERPTLDGTERELAPLAEPEPEPRPHPPTVLAEQPPPARPVPPPAEPAPVPVRPLSPPAKPAPLPVSPHQERPGTPSEESPAPPHDPTVADAPVRDSVPPGRARRRTAVLAAAAVVAVSAIAAGVVFALQGPDTGGAASSRSAGSSAVRSGATSPREPSLSASGSRAADTAAARREEEGFSWSPPGGWNRTERSPSDISYSPKDGTIELSASQGRTTEDLLTHWQRFERDYQGRPGYRKQRLERTTFAGNPAVIWEYAFLQGGRPGHGRQLGFTRGGRTYQLSVWYLDPVRATALDVYSRAKDSFRIR
ncbi:serine/threonine-protein kinase [Streptomyces varsoviensis]|uniref:serine/threonine-protein kinase n=1 Tax=Streptomyces varsoviensis TaxID=67373 RepID=UPI0033EB2E67